MSYVNVNIENLFVSVLVCRLLHDLVVLVCKIMVNMSLCVCLYGAFV